MNAYREKLESLGFSTRRGSSETTVIRNDRDGSIAGRQTEHWNDRVDAQAMVQPVRAQAKVRRVKRV